MSAMRCYSKGGRGFLLLIAFLLLPFAGYADQQQARLGSPGDEEERRYHLVFQSDFQSERDAFISRQLEKWLPGFLAAPLNEFVAPERVQSSLVMRYRIDAEQGSISAMPEYIAQAPAGEMPQYRYQQPALKETEQAIIQSGFTLTHDSQPHSTADVSYNHFVEGAETRVAERLYAIMQTPIAQPGFAQGLPVVVGETHTIQGWQHFPQIRVTVSRATDQEVLLRLQASGEDANLFGYLLVDRQSGWPFQGMAIMEAPADGGHSSERVRTAVALAPEGSNEAFPVLWLDREFPLEPWEFSSETPVNIEGKDQIVTVDEALVLEEGGLEVENDGSLLLSYEHYIDELSAYNETIYFDDFRAYEHNETLMELSFVALRPYTQPVFSSRMRKLFEAETSLALLPLGWDGVAEKVARLEAIDARVSWFGHTVHKLSIPLSTVVTEAEAHGARATLSPTDQPGTYRLRLYSGLNALFYTAEIGGAQRGRHVYGKLDPQAPDWLRSEESKMLSSMQRRGVYDEILLMFDQTPPEQLQLLISVVDPEPRQQRRVRFSLEN